VIRSGSRYSGPEPPVLTLESGYNQDEILRTKERERKKEWMGIS